MPDPRSVLADQIADKIRKLLACANLVGLPEADLLKVESDTITTGILHERVLVNIPGYTLSLAVSTILPERK